MTRKTKFLCLLLALLMSLPLASCGNTETTESTDTTGADTTVLETETTDPLAGLPVIDYEGYNFRMLIRNSEDWIGDQIAEELTGETVNDAVFKRNSETEDRYNIEITYNPSSHHNYETDAKPLILAGEDAYDLVVSHPRVAHVYANEGLVRDWNELKYVDLTQDYWDQDAVESFQMPGGLFCCIGDISHQAVGASNAMLFNKDYFDENNIEYPYELVKSGGWTFDVFAQMAETYSRDLNGDGTMDEDDLLGYATFYWIGPIQAFYSSGARVIEKGSSDYAFSVYNERSLSMFEKYFKLLNADYTALDAKSDNSFDCTSTELFREGHALFTDVNIFLVLTLREMEQNFGILPWPKLEETDDYVANVDAGTNLFTIPITVADTDRTSLIIETLAILGREYVIPAYYEVALKTRDSRDIESSDMLDIIVANRVFDLGYYNTAMGGAYASHFADLAKNNTQDFASWYDSKLKAATTDRDKTLEEYEKRM